MILPACLLTPQAGTVSVTGEKYRYAVVLRIN
jgi:hypothetical protein